VHHTFVSEAGFARFTDKSGVHPIVYEVSLTIELALAIAIILEGGFD
jgi:hypothetical protein